MPAGTLLGIDKHAHAPAEGVEYFQFHCAGFGDGIPNQSLIGEGIGIAYFEPGVFRKKDFIQCWRSWPFQQGIHILCSKLLLPGVGCVRSFLLPENKTGPQKKRTKEKGTTK